jgi:hypothetical protein
MPFLSGKDINQLLNKPIGSTETLFTFLGRTTLKKMGEPNRSIMTKFQNGDEKNVHFFTSLPA